MKKSPAEKFCPRCEETKQIENFYFYEKLSRYDSWCKKCQATRSRNHRRTTYTTEIGRLENYRRYGLTPEQFEEMFLAQGGVCAVCGQPETMINGRSKQIQKLHIDHNHNTGRVRGLLCHACNTAYGYLRENPERIQFLLEYARRQKEIEEGA